MVKEAQAAETAGYRVCIVFTQYLPDLAAFDRDILLAHPAWEYRVIRWTGLGWKEKAVRFWSGLRQKAAAKLWSGHGKGSLRLANLTASRLCPELTRLAVSTAADAYIAHNLAALPVAASAARKTRRLYAFDAEDYHRGQLTADQREEYALIFQIENAYLPGAAYVSAASPLIGEAYAGHYPGLQPVVINNTFPMYLQPPPPADAVPGKPMRLFWFSQTIGRDRGIEDVIQALGLLGNRTVELHLLGMIQEVEKTYFKTCAATNGLADGQLRFIAPVAPDDLIRLSASFDIGLALEVPYCTNRDICLTNKLFTYILAGNAVIASGTRAQTLFLQQHPGIGMLYQAGDANQLAQRIGHYRDNPHALKADRHAAWRLGRDRMNWDVEKQVFLSAIENVFA